MYKLRVSGKLNYFLNIAGLLQNGYHRLFTIMQSVDVYDTIAFSPGTGFSLICPGVPEEQNTAAKAARLFFEHTGTDSNLSIHIEKGIPFCGGMGGSSADAAGVLMGLNALYGSPPSKRSCTNWAELGSDVRFFNGRGCALCTGMGDPAPPHSEQPERLLSHPPAGKRLPHGGGGLSSVRPDRRLPGQPSALPGSACRGRPVPSSPRPSEFPPARLRNRSSRNRRNAFKALLPFGSGVPHGERQLLRGRLFFPGGGGIRLPCGGGRLRV